MLSIYWDEDEAYEAAVKSGRLYVYNDFGGNDPDYKKLHRSDCRTLKLKEGLKTTSVPKVCGASLVQLKRWLRSNRGPEGSGYTLCLICDPADES